MVIEVIRFLSSGPVRDVPLLHRAKNGKTTRNLMLYFQAKKWEEGEDSRSFGRDLFKG